MRPLLSICAILLFIGLACSQAEQAQDQPSGQSIDPGALLAQAEKSFFGLQNFHCRLRVSMPHQKGEKIVEGEIWYSGPKYHIDFPEDEMICDGKEVMTWFKEFGEVTIAPYDESKDMSLGGMYHLYKDQHELSYLGQEEGLYKIGLRQVDPNAFFPEKTFWIDPKSQLIQKYALRSPNMGTYTYQVENIEVNQTDLDASLFVIDPDFVEQVRSGEIPAQQHHGHEH